MITDSDDNSYKSPSYCIIREVYDSSNAQERFEAKLDKALETKVDYIILEPSRLGDETGRWISVGNCLHKTAVATGAASLCASIIWQNRPLFSTPLCVVSLVCTGLYTVSWNYDPCCQYQVVAYNDMRVASQLPLADVSSPVVLSYTPNSKTKYLHRSVTLLATVVCAWQIYKTYK